MNEPNPDLIRAAAAGDRLAFADLVRAHQGLVWRFLCHQLGDPALAEDVTQETFIKVYKKLDSYQFRSKFSTWVLAIARNSGIDALRKNRPRLIALDPDLLDDPRSRSTSTAVDLEAAIASLAPKLREAFLLVEVVGMRYEEAARILRVPVGTIKSRIYHARRHLMEWLHADPEGVA
ncbi:MAG: RNA polymerase sigma factor [Acidimicrobiia bacterium]